MTPETTLEEQLEAAAASKSGEVRALAARIQRNWSAGVVPSATEMRRLGSLLRVHLVCTRLEDDGRCNGWLRKHGPDAGIPADAPYKCPFASGDAVTPSKFHDCPGFRAR